MRPRSLTTTFLALLTVASAIVAAAFVWIVGHQAVQSEQQRQIADVLHRTIEVNQRLRADIQSQTSLVYHYLEERDPSILRSYEELHLGIDRAQVEYLRMDINDEQRLLVAGISDLQAELGAQGSMALQAIAGGDLAAALRHVSAMERIHGEINAILDRLSDVQARQLDEVLAQAEGTIRSSDLVLLGILAVLGGLLAVVAWLVHRRIRRPLADLLAAARRIRRGDLSARAVETGEDEVGRAAREFNYMARSLEDSYASLERKVEERASEIRTLQEQLVASERMSAVGQLVSGVAHELNNPLTTILGFAELERERLRPTALGGGGSIVGQSESALDEIVHQAERCRRIVADLLQFARQRETHRESVAINEIVERTVRLREYEAETRDVRLERNLDGSDPIVLADPYKLEQVILILVNNSMDAIRELGEPGVVTVTTRRDGGTGFVEVRDTGCGLEDPQRVFEPFYTTKEVGQGTGLGLSVAYGIVTDHGGEIRGENWAEGARFIVELPLAGDGKARLEPVAEETSRDEPSGGDVRILIVDDEQPLLRLQERMAARMGFEVETAESGEAALALLQARSFDAVVCDLRMPGRLDGRGVFDWIRENRPELADRFVFTSGAFLQLEDDVGELPALSIAKPFNFADYRAVIREALDRGEE